MDTMYSFFNWVALQFDMLIAFLVSIPDMLSELLHYLQLYVVKLRIQAQIEFIKFSYETAEILLKELGFHDMLAFAFNRLPSELRYYAFLFGIPEGISIFANALTTVFVIRWSRF